MSNSTEAPAAFFPAGPAPDLPLLLADGKKVTIERHGVASRRHVALQYPTFSGGVSTPYGILVRDATRLDLIDSADRLTTVFTRAGMIAAAVSPGGRYVAWGTQVKHGSGRTESFSGELGLFDLKNRTMLDVRSTTLEAEPNGFLADGRVTVTTGDGAVGGVLLWTPSTGAISVPDQTARELQALAGNIYYLDQEDGLGPDACWLYDDRTGAKVKVGCFRSDQRYGSPNGHRLLAWDDGDGTRTSLDSLVDIATGAPDSRLKTLLQQHSLVVADAAWVDDGSVQLVVSRSQGASKPADPAQAAIVTCAVPVSGAVTCLQNQWFGALVPGYSSHGPEHQPFLVYPAGPLY